jgi:hypothetical protein
MAKRTRAPARRPRKSARKTSNSRTRNASLSHRRTYTPELLAFARYRFEYTNASLADIAVDLGVHKRTVSSLAQREGWKRFAPPPRSLPAAVRLMAKAEEVAAAAARDHGDIAPSGGLNGDTPPLGDTIARLHRAVIEELSAVEAMRARLKREPQSPVDAERTTRTISSLTETLQKLQRLQCTVPQPGSDDDDMPADIDEFRDRLARRIEAFIASRAEPGDAGGNQAAAYVDPVR